MPELPEVEVIKRGLQPHLIDQIITEVTYNKKPLRTPVDIIKIQKEIAGNLIVDVRRRAKYILLQMGNGAILVIHLGMTGNLGIFPKETPLRKHDHIQWTMKNGNQLRYNDIRRFGSIQTLSASESNNCEETIFKTSGPEPFDELFTARYLYKRAKGKNVTVKQFIMNSQVVVGIGNIYANESLFRAGIRPDKPIKSLKLQQWKTLIETIRNVLSHAIDCGGSTISDFLNASQESGYFQMNFTVYGKAGTPCPKCTRLLQKAKIGGRASFYCNNCQK